MPWVDDPNGSALRLTSYRPFSPVMSTTGARSTFDSISTSCATGALRTVTLICRWLVSMLVSPSVVDS